MTKEFKKLTKGNETRYVLETMTAGATGASSIATAEKDLGEVQRRNPEPPKPRNFVAKNAKMGGAGAHKDKKKAQKQGQEKHRKPYMEELKDRIAELKSRLEENDLAQQMMALARSKGMNPRLAGTPDQERERTQQMMAQRAKDREEQERQAGQADAAKLPELKAEYERMKKEYESLGGSNWQYADREQNLSSAERKARSMEPQLRSLGQRIAQAEKQGDMDEDAVADFLARGGQIQRGKTHPPRKAEKWQGSSHIGGAGGKGTKGSVSGMGANTNPKGGKPVVSTEGAEFGSKYAEQLAQQVFDHNPNIEDEDQVLNLGYNISKSELGSRAQGIFRDEDFPSDFVSAYFWLKENQGQTESAPKGWEGTVKAMKKHNEIDNPWALAHWMKNKGYKSHKKEDAYMEDLFRQLEEQSKK